MSTHGSFSGNPKTEWLVDANGEDSDMRLLEDFSFTDPAGRIWLAPRGAVVNGASIPRPLWSTIGSPYTDDYRRASVVHDVACDTPSVARKDADVMFFHACRAGGCSPIQARVLYAGVRIGAWTSASLPASALSRERMLFRKRLDIPVLEEQFLQGKLADISREMESLPEEAPIEQIDAIIEQHLKF
ncbi:MAG: DUF1353 domain-containing protein [Candidatus Accumulibacter sp.]|uniref:DUF1353 domain-containing protein n=1 Tax=Accumulibacter sp. TaxID=2053492 RepID=UPI001A5CDA5B|nr:DUF1353 domain-containing protein [Accumulibacter sp.]MBL8394610.1 DUF1353 domain-containing protein [Accumulibacter sp.]